MPQKFFHPLTSPGQGPFFYPTTAFSPLSRLLPKPKPPSSPIDLKLWKQPAPKYPRPISSLPAARHSTAVARHGAPQPPVRRGRAEHLRRPHEAGIFDHSTRVSAASNVLLPLTKRELQLTFQNSALILVRHSTPEPLRGATWTAVEEHRLEGGGLEFASGADAMDGR